MATQKEVPQPSCPEYLFSPGSRSLLIGHVAVDPNLELEYIPASDTEIQTFVYSVTSPQAIVAAKKYTRERFKHWQLEDYRTYGRWIFGLISEYPERVSDHEVLSRSYRLGAGPSRDRIIDPARFGSVVNFASESGVNPNVRYGKFDSWAFDDFVEHIKKVIGEEGTSKITQPMLWRRIEAGRDEPSPAVIRTKTGSLTAVFKAAGVRSKVQLSEMEYKLIGLELMDQNGGNELTSTQVNHYSRLGKIHSTTTVVKHFGSFRNFKSELHDLYKKMNSRSQIQAREIKSWIESGQAPIALFRGVNSGQDMLRRFTRYKAIAPFLDHSIENYDEIIRHCMTDQPVNQFISSVTKSLSTTNRDMVEKAVYSVIFPKHLGKEGTASI